MGMLELLKKRRSVRQFEQQEIEQEKKDYLIECMLRSFSSRSLNPWEFILVDQPQVIKELAKAKPHGATFAKDAPLVIVVCADPAKCDVWIEDTAVATTLIHLAAESAGLGSCWIQIRKREYDENKTAGEYIREQLDIPGKYVVETMVAVGYPKAKNPGHPKESLPFGKIHLNSFGG